MTDNKDMQALFKREFKNRYHTFALKSDFDPMYFIKEDEDGETIEETSDINVAMDRIREGYEVFFSATANVVKGIFETHAIVDGYLELEGNDIKLVATNVDLGEEP